MKVAVHNLGCKVNTYESEYISNEFIKRGYELTTFDDNNADVYLINTCTVTNTSDQKSRKTIRQARKKNDHAIVAVMGCFTQKRSSYDSIKDYCDVIIGNVYKSRIIDLIEESIKTHKKIYKIEDVMDTKFDDMEMSKFNTRTRALIKIEDGCENYCSYCIIPFVRGKVRSKNPKLVIEEATKLANSGYKEIVLTGIHTGHYGADLDNYDFSDLLMDLEKVEGLERIRISSIEITELNEKFMNTLKKSKKIVNHIHIPMQAGSNHVLKLMNRKYDVNFFIETINKIKSIRPGIAITTDIIVGFPSETESDFQETMDLCKKLGLAGGHVFPYSIRQGTAAAKMKGQLTNEEKHIRVKKLISVLDNLEECYYKNHIGKTVCVIPEQVDGEYLTGHTDNYLKVRFKACKNLIGKDVFVKINNYDNKMLNGDIKNA